jgi:hypothetical protein
MVPVRGPGRLVLQAPGLHERLKVYHAPKKNAIRINVIMSETRERLQGHISSRLRKETDCLRKVIAHRQLYMQFTPVATESHAKTGRQETAINQVAREAQGQITVGETKQTRASETCIVRRTTGGFAALTLEDSNDP